MNTPSPAPFAKFIRGAKITGWWFLVIGFVMCLEAVPPVFDPHATIPVNGVPTSDFATKLGTAAFVASFPIVGAFLVFIPRRAMQRGLERVSRLMNAGL